MLIYVPLSQIDDNPFQSRQEYGDVPDLAARIAATRTSYPDSYGLLQIPRGRAIFRTAAQPDGKMLAVADLAVVTDQVSVPGKILLDDPAVRVQLAFGHRRKRAFDHLQSTDEIGYEHGLFPVQIGEFDDEEMLDAVWGENRQRKDISAVEEAELLARKLQRASSQREVADAWGLDRSTVANRLRLLELPAEIQQANRDGRLSERACLALAPVVAVQQAVNGSVKWGKRHEHWGPPIAPASFIEQAINDPKMTSEAIREYAKRALDHAGHPLPKPIADMNAPQGGDIIRASCSGCPQRLNTTCLLGTCLEAKKAAFQEQAIADAEVVLGIPFSDREEDFAHSYDNLKLLKLLWEGGQQREGTNFVVGWRLGCSAYRPFLDEQDKLQYAAYPWNNDGDGRSAIAIGHRGNLPLHLLPPEAATPAADIPDYKMRGVWRREVQDYTRAAILQAKTAVFDVLYLRLDGAEGIMQALTRNPEDWVDGDYETVLSRFVEFIWQSSPHTTRYTDLSDYYRTIELMRRMGLTQAVLSTGSPKGDADRQSIMALHGWYEMRDRSWNWPKNDTETELKRPLQDALNVCQDETMQYELRRALRDVDNQLAKEAKEAAAAQSGNLAGEEDADLYGDDYDAELSQELAESV